MRENTLPFYESGTVEEKFGRIIAPNAYVDVYEGPKGVGFVVYVEQEGKSETTAHVVGFGPEDDDWTRTIHQPRAVVAATSTEPVATSTPAAVE